MRFQEFINENTDVKKQWQKYVNSNPMIKAAVDVLNKIHKNGGNAWIVGGAVRDLVLGKEPHDIDIATTMKMDKLESIFKIYDIGKSKDFGIVVVNHKGFQFEIAQLRGESGYDGRRPTSVSFNVDLKGDMKRRDLTLNAMAIDKDGNIIDHFDGMKAINHKILKSVGNPEERFSEDYLRMLRAVRFAGKLDFDIDVETTKAIKKHKSQLVMLSSERIKDELWKMADTTGDKFVNALKLMDTLGILDIILPEVANMKTTKETERHHPEAYIEGEGTVFDHVMAALKQNKVKDPIINLSILLHDVGKPGTHKQVGDKHTYYGHAEEAKDIIDTIAKRLKLSNKEKNAIIFAAINHMKLFKGSEMKPSKIMKLVNDENWAVLRAVSYCDDKCRVGMFDKKTFDDTISNMEKITKKWGDKTTNKVVKVVDGKRVLKLTGLRPSKLVGDIIKAVTEYCINNNVKNDKDIDRLIMKFYKETSK